MVHISPVATDILLLKHQVISVHSTEYILYWTRYYFYCEPHEKLELHLKEMAQLCNGWKYFHKLQPFFMVNVIVCIVPMCSG